MSGIFYVHLSKGPFTLSSRLPLHLLFIVSADDEMVAVPIIMSASTIVNAQCERVKVAKGQYIKYYLDVLTFLPITLDHAVFLSRSLTSKSMNVSLLVDTWNLSFVHSTPDTRLKHSIGISLHFFGAPHHSNLNKNTH